MNLRTFRFCSQTRGGKSLTLCAQKRAYLALTDELRLLAESYVSAWEEEVYGGFKVTHHKPCDVDDSPYPYYPHSPSEAARRVKSWLTSKGVNLDEPVTECSYRLRQLMARSAQGSTRMGGETTGVHEQRQPFPPASREEAREELIRSLSSRRVGQLLSLMYAGS